MCVYIYVYLMFLPSCCRYYDIYGHLPLYDYEQPTLPITQKVLRRAPQRRHPRPGCAQTRLQVSFHICDLPIVCLNTCMWYVQSVHIHWIYVYR